MKFELTNEERDYFGLEPINPNWDRIPLKGDTYRSESILYFEEDTIKRHIISTDEQYQEKQYDEVTKLRTILVPKTSKGKEKKLTASTLESRQPIGVYCFFDIHGRIRIGNYNTQTTFYDSWWEEHESLKANSINVWVNEFIKTSPAKYLSEINVFKSQRRKNIKFKVGDFFSFKISREEYGFGRIILDIDGLRKKNLIPVHHGLNFIMGKPVLVKIYGYASKIGKINLEELESAPTLPSSYMMDNLLFYGQFEIIGNKQLRIDDYDFPMSYGRNLDYSRRKIFLQWGLINIEVDASKFDKYLVGDNPFVPLESPSRKISNAYGFYSIGLYPHYCSYHDIKTTLSEGEFDFEQNPNSSAHFDLRNPQNSSIRTEIMKVFGLNPSATYNENCKLTNTIDIRDLLKLI
jgi:hypothetical protein